MTAIILDNNELDVHDLNVFLKEVSHEINVHNQFYSLDSFKKFCQDNTSKVDIIFTDIFFEGNNIFEQVDVAKICRSIIITTKQKDFAVRAFRQNVTDYLLKPIQKDELYESIQKAKKMKTLDDGQEFLAYKSHLQISMGKQILNLKIHEIDFIECSNKMTYIHLVCGKRIPCEIPLYELENKLDPNLFFRANRQVIFHFDAIQLIEKYKSSKCIIRLKSNPDKMVPMSEEKSKLFKAWLDR